METDVSLTTICCLHEVIYCSLQTCNVVASEVMVVDTCVPSLTVTDITIEQLGTNMYQNNIRGTGG